jgi:hypothetical protein
VLIIPNSLYLASFNINNLQGHQKNLLIVVNSGGLIDRRVRASLNHGGRRACQVSAAELRWSKASPDCDEFRTCALPPLAASKNATAGWAWQRPLLSERGKTNPDARDEVRRGLETVDLGFSRLKVRRGGSIRFLESG